MHRLRDTADAFGYHYSLLRAVRVQAGCLRRRRRLRDGVLDGHNCFHSDLIPCAPGALCGLHRSDRLCRPHLLPGRRFENAADLARHAMRHDLTLQYFSGVATWFSSRPLLQSSSVVLLFDALRGRYY